MPELAVALAERFQQYLVQPDLPLEIRWRLARWRNRLPSVNAEPPQRVSAEEIERLVCQLDDDSYVARIGAAERLQWMAGSQRLAKSMILILKHRLVDPSVSEDSARRLESIRNLAWGVWLTKDRSDWNLPPAPDAQIEEWLGQLAQPRVQRDPRAAKAVRIARLELLDVLADDHQVSRVKAAIEARLRGPLDQEAKARLKELFDLTLPSLVAESWTGRKQTLEQHLVVGQPMQAPGAMNPSYFDRIDDHVAHCASGNALRPGDYPVGVAFPPPNLPDAIFQLVNLPTPRRQIAYSYYVKTEQAVRLAELSRRTLDRFLSEKKLLGESELGMLGQLDAREVLAFCRPLLPRGRGRHGGGGRFRAGRCRRPAAPGPAQQSSGAICASWPWTGPARRSPASWKRCGRRSSSRPPP